MSVPITTSTAATTAHPNEQLRLAKLEEAKNLMALYKQKKLNYKSLPEPEYKLQKAEAKKLKLQAKELQREAEGLGPASEQGGILESIKGAFGFGKKKEKDVLESKEILKPEVMPTDATTIPRAVEGPATEITHEELRMQPVLESVPVVTSKMETVPVPVVKEIATEEIERQTIPVVEHETRSVTVPKVVQETREVPVPVVKERTEEIVERKKIPIVIETEKEEVKQIKVPYVEMETRTVTIPVERTEQRFEDVPVVRTEVREVPRVVTQPIVDTEYRQQEVPTVTMETRERMEPQITKVTEHVVPIKEEVLGPVRVVPETAHMAAARDQAAKDILRREAEVQEHAQAERLSA